jgi:hypothetical protein
MVLARALSLEDDPEQALARYEKARLERALSTTKRAADQGRMYDGEPSEDSLRGDERTGVFSYDAISAPICILDRRAKVSKFLEQVGRGVDQLRIKINLR